LYRFDKQKYKLNSNIRSIKKGNLIFSINDSLAIEKKGITNL